MRINVEVAVDSKGVATFKQLGTAAEGAAKDVDKVAKSATFLDRVFQGIGQGLGQAAFSAIASAARAAGDGLAYLVERGVKVNDVTDSFNALTAAAGLSGEALLKAGQEGAAGMVSNFDLMAATNKALLLDLPLTAEGMRTLAEGAATLGDAIGQGPTEALNTMLEALGRGQDRILKQMGIDIDAAAAQEKYAASLGTTADQLSEAGKKAALYEAAIEAIKAKTNDLGGVQLSLADQLDQVKTRWQNLLDSMAMMIQQSPAVSAAVGGLSQMLLDLIGYLDKNKAAFQDLVKVGIVLFLGALASMGAVLTGALTVIQAFVEGITKTGTALLGAVQGAASFGAVMAKISGDAGSQAFFEKTGETAKGLSDTLKGVGDGWSEGIGKMKEGAAAMTLGLADLTSKVLASGSAAKSSGNALSDMGTHVKKAGDTIKATGADLAKTTKLLEEFHRAAALDTFTEKMRQDQEVIAQLAGQMQIILEKQFEIAAAPPLVLVSDAEMAKAMAMQRVLDMISKTKGESASKALDLAALDQLKGRLDPKLFEKIRGEIEGTKDATIDWSQKLADVAHAAQALGPAFAPIAGIIGGISAAMASLKNVSFKGGITGGKGLGGLLGNITGILGAAGAALSIGKSIVGLFTSSPAEKAAKQAGSFIGGKVSKEMGEAIAANAKKLGISIGAAVKLALPELMKESGKAASSFVPQILDLMGAIKSGSVPAAEGMKKLDESFAMLAEEASKAKFASLEMFAVMKQARESGVMTDGMRASITAAVESFGPAAEKAFGIIGTVLDDAGKEIEGAVGGLVIMTPESAVAQATVFGLIWAQTVAEKGLTEAARLLGPGFEALQSKLAQHSEGFSAAADAIFGPIAAQFALATDEMFAGASDAAMGFSDILKNAINTAMPVTIDQFNAFGQVAQDAFNQAQTAALDLGMSTQESQQQALLAVAPLLGQLQQAAAAYGFTLDAGTQALIDQAKAAGVAFPTQPVDRMANAVERLVQVLEKAFGLTSGIGDNFASIGAAAGNVGDMPGGGYNGPGYHGGYATGGIARGPAAGFGATLHGSEAVMTLPQLYGEMASIVSNSTAHMLASMIRPAPMSTSTGGATTVAGASGGSSQTDALLRELVAEQRATRRALESQPAPTLQIGQDKFGEVVRTTQRRTGRI